MSRIAGINGIVADKVIYLVIMPPSHPQWQVALLDRLGVAMLTLRRPSPTIAAVILVIAGTATSAILAGAWYYLEGWPFFLILLFLALFCDDLLALLMLSGKAENVALTGKEAMIGQIATVVDGFTPAVGLRTFCGKVRLNGELWSAESASPGGEGLAVGRKVRIRSVEGLTLIVEPEQGSRLAQKEVLKGLLSQKRPEDSHQPTRRVVRYADLYRSSNQLFGTRRVASASA